MMRVVAFAVVVAFASAHLKSGFSNPPPNYRNQASR